MSRSLVVAVLSLMCAPQALACAMYMPEEVRIATAFEEIDEPAPTLAAPADPETEARVDLEALALLVDGALDRAVVVTPLSADRQIVKLVVPAS